MSNVMIDSEGPLCQICGEPMPKGEEMFNYHGYSGPCPKTPLPKVPSVADVLKAIVKDAEDRNEPGNAWVTIRSGWIEEAKKALGM